MLTLSFLLSSCQGVKKAVPPESPKPFTQEEVTQVEGWLRDASARRAIRNPGDTNEPDLTNRERAVRIFAEDVIQLPPTGPGSDLQEYSFYIWANHPRHPQLGIQQLIDAGLLHVEITGVPLNVERRYHAPGAPALPAPVRSAGLFTRTTGNELNRDVMEVVIRSGDIHGPVRILAWYPVEYREKRFDPRQDREGDEGRWLARTSVGIRSGDLKTRIQIVDQTEARASFGEEFSRRYFVGRVYLRNENLEKKLVVYTTSMRVPVLFYRRSENPAAAHQMGQLRQEYLPRPKAPEELKGSGEVSSDVFLRELEAYARTAETTRGRPGSADQQKVWGWLDSKVTRMKADKREHEAKVGSTPASLKDHEPKVGEALKVLGKADAENLQAAWEKLRNGPPADTEASLTAFKTAAKALPAERLPTVEEPAAKLAEARIATRKVATSLGQLTDGTGLENTLRARLQVEASADGLLARAHDGGPFDERGLKVGLPGRVLATSASSKQLDYTMLGHITHDNFRPMSFQAVLHSLMLAHDEAERTRWYKRADSISRVLGGLITLSPLLPELGRQGYARSVAFTNSVVVPELARWLLDDLNKNIRNLGELSMDTVMVVEPKSAVDRYVFFPRGPIFNSPDEFDLQSPSYIVKVLDEDVFVEADLVATEPAPSSISSSSQALVDRADKGRPSLASELSRQNEVRGQAMASELATVLGKIEKALRKYKEAADDADKRTALAEARAHVREFRDLYKDEGNRAFKELFSHYGVEADDVPPTLTALPKLRVIIGTSSAARDLPVTDDFTALGDLKVEPTVSGEGVAWKSAAAEDGKSIRYHLDATGVTGAEDKEERAITLKITDKAGNVTAGTQTVVLVKPELKSEIEGAKPVPVDGATPEHFLVPTTLKPGLTLSLDIGDSDPTGWKLTATSSDDKLSILPAQTDLLIKSGTVLGGKVGLDASLLVEAADADKLVEITLQLTRADRAVGEKVVLRVKAMKAP